VQHQPSEVLEQRERARYVHDALACLPERLREVVVAYFFEGVTSAEIAEQLGVTESRVSQMRTDALKLMRAGIEAQYADKPASDPVGRGSHRAAAYAAELAARSSFATRLSQLPQQRRPSAAEARQRVAG
jgi:RNA polymerase sigma factor FliA